MIELEEAARIALRWFEARGEDHMVRLGPEALDARARLRQALIPWGGSLPSRVGRLRAFTLRIDEPTLVRIDAMLDKAPIVEVQLDEILLQAIRLGLAEMENELDRQLRPKKNKPAKSKK